MNTILKLLQGITIILLLASCGGNDKAADNAPQLENTLAQDSKITEILKKKSAMYAQAESFEWTIDPLSEFFSMNKVVLSADNMRCIADPKLCEEISIFIGENDLVFSSKEEYALIAEGLPEYRMMQKGTIEMKEKTYNGVLYYTGEGNNEVAPWFKGKLVFQLPEVKSLKEASLTFEIKGKKKK